jgi:hypothetical protein
VNGMSFSITLSATDEASLAAAAEDFCNTNMKSFQLEEGTVRGNCIQPVIDHLQSVFGGESSNQTADSIVEVKQCLSVTIVYH